MRIGIVNDLPMAAEALRRIVAMQAEHQIAWVAHDGTEAVTQCARDLPDAVLMDLIMPGMSGVEATRRIMAETPCAILLVTADIAANASCVFEALGYGAVDAIDTPELGTDRHTAGVALLLDKLDRIARQSCTETAIMRIIPPLAAAAPPVEEKLIAIGASAGGPQALAALLAALPAGFSVPIIIIQHVDRRFSAGMADWLSQQSRHPVRLVEDGDRPTGSTVLLARGNDHLCLTRTGRLTYTSEPVSAAYQPSIDVFFESICQFWQYDAIGVLLTGMGRDGAVGLKSMRNMGHHTISQDEASSTVYGMPKAAARLDAADDILALRRIAPKLIELSTAKPAFKG